MLEKVEKIINEAIEPSGPIVGSNVVILEKEQKTPSNNEKNRVVDKKGSDLGDHENAQEKIEHIAQAMDNYIQSIQRNLKIQVHKGTGQIMVKVISESDGKIIREIPPEDLLDLAAKVEEMMGVLFNQSA